MIALFVNKVRDFLEALLKAQSSESKANSFVLCRVVKSFEELRTRFQDASKQISNYYLEESTAFNLCISVLSV